MTRYEFQGTQHRTSSEMHQHMAEAFLFAGGNNEEGDVRCYFERYTNEALADEVEEVWEAARHPDYDRGEFLAAIDKVRTRLNQPVIDLWPADRQSSLPVEKPGAPVRERG